MWGMHYICDVKGSLDSLDLVRSAENIINFTGELVDSIGMSAHGAPIVKHFADHIPEAAGFSLVQLIETSSITGHFCDLTGDCYIDIFSCRIFDDKIVNRLIQEYFRPLKIHSMLIERTAR